MGGGCYTPSKNITQVGQVPLTCGHALHIATHLHGCSVHFHTLCWSLAFPYLNIMPAPSMSLTFLGCYMSHVLSTRVDQVPTTMPHVHRTSTRVCTPQLSLVKHTRYACRLNASLILDLPSFFLLSPCWWAVTDAPQIEAMKIPISLTFKSNKLLCQNASQRIKGWKRRRERMQILIPRGNVYIFVRFMDAHWNQRKVCDVRVTPIGIWTLMAIGATPRIGNIYATLG